MAGSPITVTVVACGRSRINVYRVGNSAPCFANSILIDQSSAGIAPDNGGLTPGQQELYYVASVTTADITAVMTDIFSYMTTLAQIPFLEASEEDAINKANAATNNFNNQVIYNPTDNNGTAAAINNAIAQANNASSQVINNNQVITKIQIGLETSVNQSLALAASNNASIAILNADLVDIKTNFALFAARLAYAESLQGGSGSSGCDNSIPLLGPVVCALSGFLDGSWLSTILRFIMIGLVCYLVFIFVVKVGIPGVKAIMKKRRERQEIVVKNQTSSATTSGRVSWWSSWFGSDDEEEGGVERDGVSADVQLEERASLFQPTAE
jgi:hypothetical protein